MINNQKNTFLALIFLIVFALSAQAVFLHFVQP